MDEGGVQPVGLSGVFGVGCGELVVADGPVLRIGDLHMHGLPDLEIIKPPQYANLIQTGYIRIPTRLLPHTLLINIPPVRLGRIEKVIQFFLGLAAGLLHDAHAFRLIVEELLVGVVVVVGEVLVAVLAVAGLEALGGGGAGVAEEQAPQADLLVGWGERGGVVLEDAAGEVGGDDA